MLINYLRCAHVLCIECDLSNQRISGKKMRENSLEMFRALN